MLPPFKSQRRQKPAGDVNLTRFAARPRVPRLRLLAQPRFSAEKRCGVKSAEPFTPMNSRLDCLVAIALLLATGMLTRGQQPQPAATNSFVNWETPPIHPVELSPDNARLAVCNLPDHRLEIFDVSSG